MQAAVQTWRLKLAPLALAAGLATMLLAGCAGGGAPRMQFHAVVSRGVPADFHVQPGLRGAAGDGLGIQACVNSGCNGNSPRYHNVTASIGAIWAPPGLRQYAPNAATQATFLKQDPWFQQLSPGSGWIWVGGFTAQGSSVPGGLSTLALSPDTPKAARDLAQQCVLALAWEDTHKVWHVQRYALGGSRKGAVAGVASTATFVRGVTGK